MIKNLLIILIVVLLLSSVFMSVINVSATDIKEARKRAEEILLPMEGVAGISHREDPPRIIVYLEDEKYKDKIPNEILGFKIEIVVIGKIKASTMLLQAEQRLVPTYTYSEPVSRTGVVRPIVGGISIGVPEEVFGGKMAGTLGVIVKGPGGDFYILTAAHVIAMDINANFLPIGTPVLQPGTYDGGTINDTVGYLYSYINIVFGPKGKNYADAAIAKVTINRYLINQVLDIDNQTTYLISGTTEVNVGDYVNKSGRTTGVTTNIVYDTSATVKVWYTRTKWAIFYDQILVLQPFVEPGDSGSIVYKEGRFVGIAFAGSSSVAVVCKAKYIIQGLGVSI